MPSKAPSTSSTVIDPLRRTVDEAESATTVCTPGTSRNLPVTSRTQRRQPMPPTYKVISLIGARSLGSDRLVNSPSCTGLSGRCPCGSHGRLRQVTAGQAGVGPDGVATRGTPGGVRLPGPCSRHCLRDGLNPELYRCAGAGLLVADDGSGHGCPLPSLTGPLGPRFNGCALIRDACAVLSMSCRAGGSADGATSPVAGAACLGMAKTAFGGCLAIEGAAPLGRRWPRY